MPKLVTELRGALQVRQDWSFDLRIARNEASRYVIVTGGAPGGDTWGSLDEARASVEGKPDQGVAWKASVTPGEGEDACCVCGAGITPVDEAKTRLCAVCILEAVDDRGRSLRFSSKSGFTATVIDTGAESHDPVCYVRGQKCRARGTRFGSILVVPW